MADWSSLPGELVNRIADRLLATDDLDYYMDLRAVCRGWRSSTADPKNDSARFRPRQWLMLDEVHQSDNRLFVNPSTGRFVRKDLPLLRRYFVVSGAAGGSVVLAERTAPHAARVLNPFTGAMVSFEAAVPRVCEVAAQVSGSAPTLVLFSCDRMIYCANPDSRGFIEWTDEQFVSSAHEGPLASILVPEAQRVWDLRARPFAHFFLGGPDRTKRCFLVESAGEMLMVWKLPDRVDVLKIVPGSNLAEWVKYLGSRALFVGDCRCLSVDADKFASVEANCIYYVVEEPRFEVCVYSLKDEVEVRAGRAIDSLNPITLSVDPPFSEVQLLCSHTCEIRYSQLWDKKFVFSFSTSACTRNGCR